MVILHRVRGRRRSGLERRTLCVSCRGIARHPMAVPCAVRGCIGAVDTERGKVCPHCRRLKKRLKDKTYKSRHPEKTRTNMARWNQQNREKQRAHNKASYEKHKQERLAKRHARRLREGDLIRHQDRERYKAKKAQLLEFIE